MIADGRVEEGTLQFLLSCESPLAMAAGETAAARDCRLATSHGPHWDVCSLPGLAPGWQAQ